MWWNSLLRWTRSSRLDNITKLEASGDMEAAITHIEMIESNQSTSGALSDARLQLQPALEVGKRLLELVNCLEADGGSVHDPAAFDVYSSWYLKHLRHCLLGHLDQNGGRASLDAFLPQGNLPSDNEQAAACAMTILMHIADELRSRDSSLASILSRLRSGSSNQPQANQNTSSSQHGNSTSEAEGNSVAGSITGLEDEETINPREYRSLFAAISWLLKVYSTAPPTPGEHQPARLVLDISDPMEPSRQLRSECVKRPSCILSTDTVNLQFEYLLNLFGNLLPQIPPSVAVHGSVQGEAIISNNFSYYVLLHMAGIRVVWVDSLSLHLEFDARTSTLKLFRFPSFCAMLALPRDTQMIIFDTVFSPKLGDGSSDMDGACPYSQDFFVEVLCSYRLIFGQHSSARSLYRHSASCRPATTAEEADPLLEKLCGGSPKNCSVFVEVDAFPVRAVYSTRFDFRFLGPRLLLVQDFVTAQAPGGFKGLWYDVRDVNRFYTFWAVIIVGGISILLSGIQTVLTGMQLRPDNPSPGGH